MFDNQRLSDGSFLYLHSVVPNSKESFKLTSRTHNGAKICVDPEAPPTLPAGRERRESWRSNGDVLRLKHQETSVNVLVPLSALSRRPFRKRVISSSSQIEL